MKKKILLVLLCIFLFLCLVGGSIWIKRTYLFSQVLSRSLGIEIDIEDFNVSWGKTEITGLRIGNPLGSKISDALRAKQVILKFSPQMLFTGPFIFDEISVDGVFLNLEMYDAGGKKSNWARILDSQEQVPKLGSEKSIRKKNKEIEVRNLIVRKLWVNNIKVQVDHPFLGRSKTEIPRFYATDIGDGAKLSSRQTTRLMIRMVIAYVMNIPQLQGVLKGAINLPKNVLKGIFFPGKELKVELDEKKNDSSSQGEVKDEYLKLFEKMGIVVEKFTKPDNGEKK